MRTVPRISQLSGTTLVASPVWIIVTEITPASIGRLLRLMMVWKAFDHVAGDGHRVDAVVRHRRVRALAVDDDAELVARGEDRSAAHRELADLHAGPVVGAEDGVHREQVEQALP